MKIKTLLQVLTENQVIQKINQGEDFIHCNDLCDKIQEDEKQSFGMF